MYVLTRQVFIPVFLKIIKINVLYIMCGEKTESILEI